MRRVLAAGAILAAILTTTPASALDMTRSDPIDAPAGADIRSVTYRDREFTASAAVRVRDLQRSGSMELAVAHGEGTDQWPVATAWIRRDGSLGKRFESQGNFGRAPLRCPHLGANWSSARNIVTITIPHSCLKLGFTRHAFSATMRAGGRTDRTTWRQIGRGSSPGCVTRTEFTSIKKGFTKQRVEALFDTRGRLDEPNPGQAKVYRICGVGEGAYVVYRHSVGAWRVAEKAWLTG